MGSKKRSREQQQFGVEDEGLFEPQRKLLISGGELLGERDILESFSDALAEPERLVVLDVEGQAEELLLSGAAVGNSTQEEEDEECVSNLYGAPWALASRSSDDCLEVGSRPISQPFNQNIGEDAEYLFGGSDGISSSLGGTEFISSVKDEGFPFASTPLDAPPALEEAESWQQLCDGDWSLDSMYAWESDDQEWMKRAVASLEMEPQCALESSVLEAGLAVL